MPDRILLAILAAIYASGTNHSAASAVDQAEAILAETTKRYPEPSMPDYRQPEAEQENA
jgi:hypothetical protein